MRKLNAAAAILTIIGGLNWGLVGLFKFDLVAAVFALGDDDLVRIVRRVEALGAPGMEQRFLAGGDFGRRVAQMNEAQQIAVALEVVEAGVADGRRALALADQRDQPGPVGGRVARGDQRLHVGRAT